MHYGFCLLLNVLQGSTVVNLYFIWSLVECCLICNSIPHLLIYIYFKDPSLITVHRQTKRLQYTCIGEASLFFMKKIQKDYQINLKRNYVFVKFEFRKAENQCQIKQVCCLDLILTLHAYLTHGTFILIFKKLSLSVLLPIALWKSVC